MNASDKMPEALFQLYNMYVHIIQNFTPFLLMICTRLRFFIYGGNIYILFQVHDTKVLLRRLIDLFSYSMV